MAGKLFIVGTPIGNLGDMSPRSVEALKNADFIAAEDTRVTIKLLNQFDISTPMMSVHEHNEHAREGQIIGRILAGESCALVTDAGMPCISDPGGVIVKAAHDAGVEVVSVPGPSAAIAALSISGIEAARFCFEGFLSMNKPARREHLESLVGERRTMVFYEAPHKLKNTLSDMLKYFGDRQISLCREITKLHEEVMRTTLTQAVAYYEENTPRGEYVLVLAGDESEAAPRMDREEAISYAKSLLEQGIPPSDAAKRAAKESGLSKSEIYKSLIER